MNLCYLKICLEIKDNHNFKIVTIIVSRIIALLLFKSKIFT